LATTFRDSIGHNSLDLYKVIGEIHRKSRRYDQALVAYQEVLSIIQRGAHESNSLMDQAETMGVIASLYVDKNHNCVERQFTQAIWNYTQALELLDKISPSDSKVEKLKCIILLQRAGVYLTIQEEDNAVRDYQRATELVTSWENMNLYRVAQDSMYSSSIKDEHFLENALEVQLNISGKHSKEYCQLLGNTVHLFLASLMEH
jgi:tetratricopeptide (TPR) repeat protein